MTLEAFKDKRITFFVPEAPPSFSGAGINAFNFARFISGYAKRTTLCHLNYNRKQRTAEYHDKLKLVRIAYFNCNLLTKIGSLPNLFFQYLRQVHSSDLIFVYSGYLIGFQFIIIIGSLLGKRVIFRSSIMGGDDATSLLKKNFVLHALNKYTLKHLSLYFAINPEFSRRFKVHFQSNIPILESCQGVDITKYHPVDEELKQNLRLRLELKPADHVLLSVGILLARKGYESLFKTLALLDMDFIYILLGEYSPDGIERLNSLERRQMKELHEMGKQLLGEKLIFADTKNSVEVYYQASDIFVHGAEQEGTPNALLEAMSCGLPCIVKNIEGISGYLIQHNQNAYEYNTTEDLCSIISELMKEPEKGKHIADAASKTISENYTFEKVMVKLFDKING